jgi:hypothetical protein
LACFVVGWGLVFCGIASLLSACIPRAEGDSGQAT